MMDLIEKYRIEESDPPTPPGTGLWLKFHGYDVRLQRTDEGIAVDVWEEGRIDEPMASTYAFDNEREG